jgi:hypothetical protein
MSRGLPGAGLADEYAHSSSKTQMNMRIHLFQEDDHGGPAWQV